MRKIVVFESVRKVGFQEFDEEQLGEGQVRVKTLYSGISAGTELTNYRGQNAKLQKQWDSESRLYLDSPATSKSFPFMSEGYEEVGEIVELGKKADKLKVGDLVCGGWGHWTTAVLSQDEAETGRLPEGVEPITGIFVSIARVALNGILDAQINLGETVAVFGLGVVGQITAQLAKLSGATVIGVDMIESRLRLCHEVGGVDVLINASELKAGEKIKELTGKKGADICIECTGAAGALHEAIRACTYSSKVIAMGLIPVEGKGLFLGEEFHQNRINIVCSQIFGINPGLRHRWNDTRLWRTVLTLMSQKKLRLNKLISHRFKFEEAAKAFELIDKKPAETMEVVLTF
ncbi:MAG: zinc-binding dehydrogenase [bacterium]